MRLARVDAHPHADRRRRASACCPPRAAASASEARGERDEERVALRVDLDALVGRERRRAAPPVLGQRVGVAVAELARAACVEPSMSVKRKVTVPPGSSRTP